MISTFIPLDYDYKEIRGKNIIIVYGKTKNNKKIALLDEIKDYFYVLSKNPEKIKKKLKKEIKAEIVKKNFLEKEVKALKIYVKNNKQQKEISDKIKLLDKNSERKEIDIHLLTRYIIDKEVCPLKWYEIEGEEVSNSQEYPIAQALDVDIVIKAEKIKEIKQENFSPKILAFDIEADDFEIGKGNILMISLVGDNFKKVLTWKKEKGEDYVEHYKDEADMIEAFIKYIKQEKPDILTGYFSDNFDMPYLRARANKNNIKLDLSLDGSQPKFSHGRIMSAKLKGITHLDMYRFIQTNYSQYLSSETLSLNEVSNELLGESKLDVEDKTGKSLKKEDWKEFYAYNLQDSVLTYKLAEKAWPDIQEFTRIVQEPLQDVVRNSMSQHVEDYIIHNLKRFNEIAERTPIHEEIGKRKMRKRYTGAFVFQPTPGLYENLCMFDFTSYWPSIISSFNLSLSTFSEKKQKGYNEIKFDDKKFYFAKKKGFFPLLLEEIIKLRKKYKQEYKKNPSAITKARSNAYKLLANASYGYQGFFGARYYCLEASASTTGISREFIQKIIGKINKQSYKVLYADTDSIAFLMGKKTKKETLDFLKILNKELPGIMELDLEDFYKRGIWVTKRTGEYGAKKKYALINEKNKIKIRGFETVRRDWCSLARKLQSEVINLILRQGNPDKALELFKKTVKELKLRKINKKQILIKTQLKKPINQYKSISPHVVAAQKMKDEGEPVDVGMLIKYFIAEVRSEKAKKLVREKVKLPGEKGEYNIKYYLERQIIPSVENIFQVFNINLKEIASGFSQKKLF